MLQNASCKNSSVTHSKGDRGDFSVIVASKPTFPSENNVESDRQPTGRELDSDTYQNKRDVFIF